MGAHNWRQLVFFGRITEQAMNCSAFTFPAPAERMKFDGAGNGGPIQREHYNRYLFPFKGHVARSLTSVDANLKAIRCDGSASPGASGGANHG